VCKCRRTLTPPGPWCVYRRNNKNSSLELIYKSDTMPSSKQVALEILPSSLGSV